MMADITERMADQTDQPAPVRDLTLSAFNRAGRSLVAQTVHGRGMPLIGPIQARRAEGETPVVVPRIILQAPLWSSARAARQTQGMRYEWVQPDPEQRGIPVEWVVETQNPLDHIEGDERKRIGDPFGRLQWFDLDLLLCLSLEFFRRNCQTTYITVDQTSVLQWIGYKQVHDPPYAELRSSIRRMSWTQIAWYRRGEKDTARGIDLLSKESSWERGSRSRPGEIVALLSDSWLKQIYDTEGDRQIIDLARYFHLVRHLRNAEQAPDLTRSVFTFLASLAKGERSEAKTDWLIERFAQRQLVKSTGKVHLRYADPLRQGQLADALSALVQSGVCNDVTIDGDRLTVQWRSAKLIGAIPSSAKQDRIVDTDLRTGTIVLIGHEGPPDLAGRSLAEALTELRSRAMVSAALENQQRTLGWRPAHLVVVYAAAILQAGAEDPGSAAAVALSGDWRAWTPAAVQARDPALFEQLFAPGALLSGLLAELRAADAGPEHLAERAQRTTAPTAAEPVAPAVALARLRPRLGVAAEVEQAARLAGWTDDEMVRLYLVALWQSGNGSNKVRHPAAWAAKLLRSGKREDWSRDAAFRQFPVDLIYKWAYGSDGPLAPPAASPVPVVAPPAPAPVPVTAMPVTATARVAERSAPGPAFAGTPATPTVPAELADQLRPFVPILRARLKSLGESEPDEREDLQAAMSLIAGVLTGSAAGLDVAELKDRATGLMGSSDPQVSQAGARLHVLAGGRKG